ncbi:MAG: hypothetical protein LJE96_13380 [Deltaproteobacteria bacterium]|jgi:hypothetical protein|nr:hypothetical protein [Deltaproteobacteria bacterium]
MKVMTVGYILNATLLILHEIESAYEKEWDILKLPGNVTGFLLLHIPIIFLIFYGLIEIEKGSTTGMVLGVVLGIAGIIPFMVHKLIIKTPDQFNLPISNVIMYSNILSGLGLLFLSARGLAG